MFRDTTAILAFVLLWWFAVFGGFCGLLLPLGLSPFGGVGGVAFVLPLAPGPIWLCDVVDMFRVVVDLSPDLLGVWLLPCRLVIRVCAVGGLVGVA